MKGKEVRKEKKKEKADPKAIKVKSSYQKENGSKQDYSVNPSPKK